MKKLSLLCLLFAAAPLSASEQQSSAAAMKQEQSAAPKSETLERSTLPCTCSLKCNVTEYAYTTKMGVIIARKQVIQSKGVTRYIVRVEPSTAMPGFATNTSPDRDKVIYELLKAEYKSKKNK